MANPIDEEDDEQAPAEGDEAEGEGDTEAPAEGEGDEPPAPGSGMMAGGSAEDGTATPQLKAAYQKFLLTGHALIYSPGTFPIIVKKLRLGAQQDPVGTLAQLVVMVVQRLSSTQQAGQELPQGLMLKAGAEFIEEIAEISEKAKAHVFTDDEKQGALYRGADMYRVMLAKQGKTDPAGAKQEIEQLKQAYNDGELNKAAPNLGAHFSNMATKHKMRGGPPAPANNKAPPAKASGGRGMLVGA